MSAREQQSYYLLTLGCAKNRVDSAAIRRALQAHGLSATEDPREADYLILNTCGFITPAKEESIETVLELAGIKETNPAARVLMTGCFVQRNSTELAAELPEIDGFFGTDCAELLVKNLDSNGVFVQPSTSSPEYHTSCGTADAEGVNSFYIKISEGCDNRCSYCAIPLIRGGYRPRPAAEIINEVARLLENNSADDFIEINLISQDTSRYFDPHNPAYRLEQLLDDIEQLPGSPRWIRALYLHPASLRPELIERMCRPGSVLPYFDIPVQHLSDHMLAQMNRHHDWEHLQSLLTGIRRRCPDATVRTTVIVGHPGETAEDHKLLLQRLQQIEFDKLGAFVYSDEEGTVAAACDAKRVDKPAALRRYNQVMAQQKKISASRLTRFLNRTIPVLIEEPVSGEPGMYIGRGTHDAPDVDGAVVVQTDPANRLKGGTLVQVKILQTMDYDLYGESV